MKVLTTELNGKLPPSAKKIDIDTPSPDEVVLSAASGAETLRLRLQGDEIVVHQRIDQKLLKERDGIPEAEQIRRALRGWLQERNALFHGVSPKGVKRGARRKK